MKIFKRYFKNQVYKWSVKSNLHHRKIYPCKFIVEQLMLSKHKPTAQNHKVKCPFEINFV